MNLQQRINELAFDPSKLKRANHNECNWCGSRQVTKIEEYDRYGFNNPASLCQKCELVFLNKPIDNVDIGYFYSNWYRPLVSAYHNRVIDHKTIQEEQRVYGEYLKEKLKENSVNSIQKCLDIGGSTGVVLDIIRKENPQMSGTILDPAPDELNEAASHGFEIVNGTLENLLPEKLDGFDLILMCQTIDHLTDLKVAMNKIDCLLKRNSGLLYFDILEFQRNIDKNGVCGSLKIDHPYYFTEIFVDKMLAEIDINVIAKWELYDKIHVGYLCQKG